MVNYKIKKLDRRMNGYGRFSHVIHFSTNDFLKQRVWFWESFGPSCELCWWDPKEQTGDWCWDSSEYCTRIYVSQAALAHFMLVQSS